MPFYFEIMKIYKSDIVNIIYKLVYLKNILIYIIGNNIYYRKIIIYIIGKVFNRSIT